MVILNLFPGGILQLLDVFRHGYWHARSPLFMATPTMRVIEWLRMPADLVFITLGVVPLLIAGLRIYRANLGVLHRPAAVPVTGIPSAVRNSGD
jgi:nitric oxide reductase subunit B